MATCVFDFSSFSSSCPIFLALYPFSLSAFSNACRSGIQSSEIRARGTQVLEPEPSVESAPLNPKEEQRGFLKVD